MTHKSSSPSLPLFPSPAPPCQKDLGIGTLGYTIKVSGSFKWALVYVDANAPTAVFSYLVIVGGLAMVPVIKVAIRSELAKPDRRGRRAGDLRAAVAGGTELGNLPALSGLDQRPQADLG